MEIVDLRINGPKFPHLFVACLIGMSLGSSALVILRHTVRWDSKPGRYLVLNCLVDFAICLSYPYFSILTQWELYSSSVMFHILIAKFAEIFVLALQQLISSVLLCFLASSRDHKIYSRYLEIICRKDVIFFFFCICIIPAIVVLALSNQIIMLNAYCFISSTNKVNEDIIHLMFIVPKLFVGIGGLVAAAILWRAGKPANKPQSNNVKSRDQFLSPKLLVRFAFLFIPIITMTAVTQVVVWATPKGKVDLYQYQALGSIIAGIGNSIIVLEVHSKKISAKFSKASQAGKSRSEAASVSKGATHNRHPPIKLSMESSI